MRRPGASGSRLLAGALALVAGMAHLPPAWGQQRHSTDHHEVVVEALARDLVHPWGLALLPDGRFLVTERNPGHLRVGEVGGELSPPVEGVPEIFRYEGETERSQAGLFDVKLHPDFTENRLVYLSLSKPTERGAALAIVRGRLDEESGPPRLEDVEEIFLMKEDDQDSSGLHFGGRMVFATDGQALYLAVGDRRNISRAQDLEDQAGSILRMTLDGDPAGAGEGIAADDGSRDPYVWSYGHRNPQGLVIHPEHGDLWAVDHGPLGGDALKRVEEGTDHGWPFFTGGVDYSGAPLGHASPPEGVVPPVHVFERTVAPSGMVFYRGTAFPGWEGDLLIGGLMTEGIVRVRLGPDGSVLEQEEMLTEVGRRIRDVQVAPDGSVWVITEHADGEVLRISPAGR